MELLKSSPSLVPFAPSVAQLVVTAAATGTACYVIFQFLTPKPIGDIPHNRFRFLVGDIPAILDYVKRGVGLGKWISEQSLRLGPVLSIHMGPWLTKVAVTDPLEIEDIMNRRYDEFGFSEAQRAVFGGAMPMGLLSLPSNSMWTAHRRSLSPCMSTRYLKASVPRINSIVKQVCNLMERQVATLPPGACFDLSGNLQLCSMDMISIFTFGEAFGGVQAAISLLQDNPSEAVHKQKEGVYTFQLPEVPLHNAVRVLFDAMGEAVLSPLPNFTYWLCHRRRSWKEAHRLFFEYLDVKLNQARVDFKDAQVDKTTVPEIVFAREEHHGSFPDAELKDEMLNLLLAAGDFIALGQDTTSSAMKWILKLLSHHPEVQEKLRAHLKQRVEIDIEGGTELSFDDVRAENVPYLEAVIWESLRISQIGLFISRMATRDTQILGHFIPKGTEIVLHLGHAGVYDTVANAERAATYDHKRGHHNKKSTRSWLDDGSSFNPGRWLDEEGNFDERAGLTLPFGGGPRLCFGYRLALLQLKLTLAELNARFFFQPPVDPEVNTWNVKETVIRAPADNYIVLQSRSDS